MVDCFLDMEDPRFSAFLSLLEREGLQRRNDIPARHSNSGVDESSKVECVTWRLWRVDQQYTTAELRAAPFLALSAEREIETSATEHGTQYDFSTGCPGCGTGAVQTSPYYAPASSFPEFGMMCASTDAMFVAESVARAFLQSGVTGVELRMVLSPSNQQVKGWRQMIVQNTLPKMSEKTKGIVRGDPAPCALCLRDGHYMSIDCSFDIAYSSAAVSPPELPDVVQTWECFGKSQRRSNSRLGLIQRVAPPLVVIKPNVYEIVRSLKMRQVRLYPVRIL